MKARDAGRLDAVRNLMAAVKSREIELREGGKQVRAVCAVGCGGEPLPRTKWCGGEPLNKMHAAADWVALLSAGCGRRRAGRHQ
jgi:hypothetical protein